MIKSNIVSGHGKKFGAEVISATGEKNALVVATTPLKTKENSIRFFTSSEYGIDMNVNVSFGGTPEIVHDGIDLTKWTAGDIVGGGKTTFDNNDHAYEGIMTVVDFSAFEGGETFTINATTRTEGVDWNVGINNDATATAIAADITNNVTGFTASANGAVVTVLAEINYDITTFSTTADAAEMIVSAASVKVDNSPVGDIYQFDKGGDLDCNGYVALTMWIYVDKDWKNNDVVDIYGWDTDTNLQVGIALDLSDYFIYGSYDIWQKIVIPLSDFGALASYTTLDALRIRQTAKQGGKAPKYYVDAIQFEQTGEPAIYTLTPDKGTWLHVNSFKVSFADAMAGTLANGTMPAIAYDKFLGVSLVAGISYQRVQLDEPQFTQTITDLMGFLQLPGTRLFESGSDGTNTWLTVDVIHQEPLILKAEESDKLQWTVSEDLSGLLHFRISAGCSIETRAPRG